MASETIQEAVNEELVLGEAMVTFASGLAGAAPNALEVTAVVLTTHCLMLVHSAAELGYELGAVYELTTCSLVKYKTLPDASQLMIVRHKTGLLYLHFAASWESQAKRMMDAFAPTSSSSVVKPDVPADKEGAVQLVDTFSLVSEFAGLGASFLGEEDE